MPMFAPFAGAETDPAPDALTAAIPTVDPSDTFDAPIPDAYALLLPLAALAYPGIGQGPADGYP